MREVEVSIGQKLLDVNTKGVLVCYIFVSDQFSGFLSLPGQFKFEGLKTFRDVNQEGVDKVLVTVSQ